jgi:hypothetical protein
VQSDNALEGEMELDDMVLGLKRVDDELEFLGQAEDGHLRKPIREARIVIEALNGNALRNRIAEIMCDQLAGDEERNPAGVPIYGIDEAADMILAEVIKNPSNQAVAGHVVRDCATCSDQLVIPPNCPSCGGRGGFGAYRIAGSIVYACPTVRDNPVQAGALIVAEID